MYDQFADVSRQTSFHERRCIAHEQEHSRWHIMRHVLQVDERLLLTALTTRSIDIIGGERITTRLSPEAAAEARDSLAKNLYARLFDWIVAAVNRKISALGDITTSQSLAFWILCHPHLCFVIQRTGSQRLRQSTTPPPPPPPLSLLCSPSKPPPHDAHWGPQEVLEQALLEPLTMSASMAFHLNNACTV